MHNIMMINVQNIKGAAKHGFLNLAVRHPQRPHTKQNTPPISVTYAIYVVKCSYVSSPSSNLYVFPISCINPNTQITIPNMPTSKETQRTNIEQLFFILLLKQTIFIIFKFKFIIKF